MTYTLSWVDPWEPFYIGPHTVHLYDGFRQYGFNRISQVCIVWIKVASSSQYGGDATGVCVCMVENR